MMRYRLAISPWSDRLELLLSLRLANFASGEIEDRGAAVLQDAEVGLVRFWRSALRNWYAIRCASKSLALLWYPVHRSLK
jgi:hypothetical protein